MTVGQLLRTVSSKELAEWMAFYYLDAEDEKQRALEMKAKYGLNARKSRRR